MISRTRSMIYLAILSGTLFLSCEVRKSAPASAPQMDTHVKSESVESDANKQDIVAKLKENGHLAIDKQVSLYRMLKATDPAGYNFENEDQLTMYGYGFLWNDQASEALQIFELIAEQFPESANAYDSIGEAYFALDKKEESLKYYQKSLAMNPDNYNAEDYIEKIKYPNKKKESPSDLFTKVYSAQAYKEDLEELSEKLIKTHPAIFKFSSEKDFKNTVEEKKTLITDQTTYGTFRWYCSEIIANVNCSHSGMGGFYPEDKMLPIELRFPIQTTLIDGSLYVTEPLNNKDLISEKEEIISINGLPVATLIDDIYKHIPSQGLIKTSKRLFFNKWSTGIISYALDFPEQYTLEIKGSKNPVVLVSAKFHKDPVINNPIVGCGEPLCLELIDEETAVLSIFSFNFYRWNIYDKFVEFMDKSFLEIKEKNIKNLVIDVRQNGGGAPEASIYLLQYLVDSPFTYFPNREKINGGGVRLPKEHRFKGNQYYLIDGHGNSTTGHFMAMVKKMELGTIIGEELGSNQFCTAGQTIFKLKNTRLEFYSANNSNRVAVNSLPDERGILPEHNVDQSIDDYLNKVDVVKDYVVHLIKE